MSILNNILGFFGLRSNVNGLGKSQLRTTSTMIGGSPLVYPEIDQEYAIRKGYEGNGAVYSVVKKDAKKFASIPQYVYKVRGKEREQVSNELSKLLNRPNEYQGQDAFKEAVKGFYMVTGEAFIWLNRGDVSMKLDKQTGQLILRSDAEIDAMPVLEMYVMPSNHVYLVPDPANVFGIIGYEFQLGGKRVPIRKNDVIHWRSTSLCFDAYSRQHLRGLSPLTPGKRILQQNNDATDSSVRMFQNDGARGVLYNETWDNLTPQQRSQVEDVVNRKVNNNDIKGAIATVQGKWGYTNFGGTAVDMELIDAVDMSMKQVCMLFDVPAELFDTAVTYENKEKAMKGWVYNSIIPASKQYDDELNRILLRSFNLVDQFLIACDYTELPELQEDISLLTKTLNSAWWITPNERRKGMGYDPIPDPKLDEVWIPTGYTPLSQLEDDGFNQMVNDLNNQNAGSY